jgi:hypothetical protein
VCVWSKIKFGRQFLAFNPNTKSLISFGDTVWGRTDGRTDGPTDKNYPICNLCKWIVTTGILDTTLNVRVKISNQALTEIVAFVIRNIPATNFRHHTHSLEFQLLLSFLFVHNTETSCYMKINISDFYFSWGSMEQSWNRGNREQKIPGNADTYLRNHALKVWENNDTHGRTC